MYQHLTKLFLAGVAALALLALGTTSILAPAWAAKPGKLPINCVEGEVAKWSPLPGTSGGDYYWACKADTDTLAELDCATDQIAIWDDNSWVCSYISDGSAGPRLRTHKRDSHVVGFVIQGLRRETIDERQIFLADGGTIFAT